MLNPFLSAILHILTSVSTKYFLNFYIPSYYYLCCSEGTKGKINISEKKTIVAAAIRLRAEVRQAKVTEWKEAWQCQESAVPDWADNN